MSKEVIHAKSYLVLPLGVINISASACASPSFAVQPQSKGCCRIPSHPWSHRIAEDHRSRRPWRAQPIPAPKHTLSEHIPGSCLVQSSDRYSKMDSSPYPPGTGVRSRWGTKWSSGGIVWPGKESQPPRTLSSYLERPSHGSSASIYARTSGPGLWTRSCQCWPLPECKKYPCSGKRSKGVRKLCKRFPFSIVTKKLNQTCRNLLNIFRIFRKFCSCCYGELVDNENVYETKGWIWSFAFAGLLGSYPGRTNYI